MWKSKEESLELIDEFYEFVGLSKEEREIETGGLILYNFINWIYKVKKWQLVNKHQQPHDVDKYYEE